MPLVWASRLQGTPLPRARRRLEPDLEPERAPPPSAGDRSSCSAARPAPPTARPRCCCRQFPDAQDRRHALPALRVRKRPDDDGGPDPGGLVTRKPDIVFVALGSPKQEQLIQRLRAHPAARVVAGRRDQLQLPVRRRAPRTAVDAEDRAGVDPPPRAGAAGGCSTVTSSSAFRSRLRLLGGAFVDGLPRRLGLRRRASGGFRRASGPAVPAAHDSRNWRRRPSFAIRRRRLPHGVRGRRERIRRCPPRAARCSQPLRRAGGASEQSVNGSDRRVTACAAGAGPARRLRPPRRTRPAAPAARCSTFRSTRTARSSTTGSTRRPNWLVRVGLDAAARARDGQPPNSPEPASADPRHYGTFRVERDLSEYRGTGGVLRDLADDYADDDLILVANAAQILLDPLSAIVDGAADATAATSRSSSHEDGTPSGVMLVSCKTLRLIPETGLRGHEGAGAAADRGAVRRARPAAAAARPDCRSGPSRITSRPCATTTAARPASRPEPWLRRRRTRWRRTGARRSRSSSPARRSTRRPASTTRSCSTAAWSKPARCSCVRSSAPAGYCGATDGRIVRSTSSSAHRRQPPDSRPPVRRDGPARIALRDRHSQGGERRPRRCRAELASPAAA